MTRTNIDAALAAANPLTADAATRLLLGDADAELVERIVAAPVRPRPRRAHRAGAERRRLALVFAATALAAAAAFTLLPSGERGGGPAPAFAAPLVHFANASPLALLRLPGWHVVYADEQANGFGEMHFVRGRADASGNPVGSSFADQASRAARVASLTWTPTTLVGASLRGHQSAATGLGVTAHEFIYEGGSRRAFDISALFPYRRWVLEFRATVTSMAMFRSELAALAAVDTDAWLRAMPPSVVNAADSTATVRVMLKGIPLPPGFDAARIRGVRLVHDRYQLGAAVTGTIACMWIADWNRARQHGDTAMVRRAVAAMATAPHWPILHEMAREGAWPQVLISFARAMPSGTVKLDHAMPLLPAVNSGLGCGSSWGVDLARRRLEPVSSAR